MKRPLFFLLLGLPFLLIPIIKDEPVYFLLAAVYLWLVQFARLLFVGVSWKKALLAFTGLGLGYWAKMFREDPAKGSFT